MGTQQDVEFETGKMLEPEQKEDVPESKEKNGHTETGHAEPVAGAVTGIIEAKNENVSGETAFYDRDSVFSYNVNGGGVHSAIPLNYAFNQKVKAKKKYYREFGEWWLRKAATVRTKYSFERRK